MNQIKLLFMFGLLLLSACSPEDSHARDNDVTVDDDMEQIPGQTESKVNPDSPLTDMKSKVLMSLCLFLLSVFTMGACNSLPDKEGGSEMYKNRDLANPVVEYLGQASLRIVTEQGKVIYIDPYAGDDYSLGSDLILVTHEHFDHNAIKVVAVRNEGCQIIRSSDAIVDGKHKTFQFEFVTIESVETGNNRYHDIDNCVGYVLTFQNGKKVYVSGDTSTTEQMKQMDKMEIDYAFLCTDGVYNMGLEEAAAVAEIIKAKYVIPYHNCIDRTQGNFSLEAAEAFQAPNKIIIKPGEYLEIK